MTKYFYGNKISEYGLQNGYVDYKALTKSFDAVLCNNIVSRINEGFCELENGSDYDEENDNYVDIYQYYIIDDLGARILKRYTKEIVYYDNELDIYIWGITHYGTAWDYVLTDISIKSLEE